MLCSCIAQAYPELEQNEVWFKQFKESLIVTLGKFIEIVVADFKVGVNDMCLLLEKCCPNWKRLVVQNWIEANLDEKQSKHKSEQASK